MTHEIGRWFRRENEKKTRAWAAHLELTIRKQPGRTVYRISDQSGGSVAVESMGEAREMLQRVGDEKEWGARQPAGMRESPVARVTAATELGPPSNMLAALEEGGNMLTKTADDFERISIRTRADAIRSAAAVLKYRDIQIQAAELVMSAERQIAFANPAKPVGRPREDVVPEEQVIRPPGLGESMVRDLRCATR